MKKFFALIMAISCMLTCFGALAETAERIPAPYTYTLADDETLYVENLIFNGDVVIRGGSGMVLFVNCEFNGNVVQTSETDSQLFSDTTKPEQGMVPYEGQEANCFVIAQWWENGEQNILLECEYDPTI